MRTIQWAQAKSLVKLLKCIDGIRHTDRANFILDDLQCDKPDVAQHIHNEINVGQLRLPINCLTVRVGQLSSLFSSSYFVDGVPANERI